jgi:hypothetical protein
MLLCDVAHHLDLFEKTEPTVSCRRTAIAIVLDKYLAARRQRASSAPSIAETRYINNESVFEGHGGDP